MGKNRELTESWKRSITKKSGGWWGEIKKKMDLRCQPNESVMEAKHNIFRLQRHFFR